MAGNKGEKRQQGRLPIALSQQKYQMKKIYEVLCFSEEGEQCVRSVDCMEGELLVSRLMDTPQVERETVFAWFLQLAEALDNYQRSRNGQNYRCLTPYSVLVTAQEELFLLNLEARENEFAVQKMQKQAVRNHFISPAVTVGTGERTVTDFYSFGRMLEFILASVHPVPELTRAQERRLKRIVRRLTGELKKPFSDMHAVWESLPRNSQALPFSAKKHEIGAAGALGAAAVCLAAGFLLGAVPGNGTGRYRAEETAEETTASEEAADAEIPEEADTGEVGYGEASVDGTGANETGAEAPAEAGTDAAGTDGVSADTAETGEETDVTAASDEAAETEALGETETGEAGTDETSSDAADTDETFVDGTGEEEADVSGESADAETPGETETGEEPADETSADETDASDESADAEALGETVTGESADAETLDVAETEELAAETLSVLEQELDKETTQGNKNVLSFGEVLQLYAVRAIAEAYDRENMTEDAMDAYGRLMQIEPEESAVFSAGVRKMELAAGTGEYALAVTTGEELLDLLEDTENREAAEELLAGYREQASAQQ